jgi:ubiquinone/menaquinone biosynthesis C-methylase UbiE
MQLAAGLAFDKLADTYDAAWTNTNIGRSQRAAVWRYLDPLFPPGSSILDLGCGTGADAAHFTANGASVFGIDASEQMVRVARKRGVNARCCYLEHLDSLNGNFDGGISNFGVLNCVPNMTALSTRLGRVIRPGGYLALCTMSPLCLWEACYFLKKAQGKQAFRRLSRGGVNTSVKVRVTYPSIRRLVSAFADNFKLLRWAGIGLFVPPSYVSGLSEALVERFQTIDSYLAHQPVLRIFADHRLLIFTRL